MIHHQHSPQATFATSSINKALAAAYALLLAVGAFPSHAGMTAREKSAYEYGWEWGYITATCLYHREGMISSGELFTVFKVIETDEGIPEKLREKIFRNIHKRAMEDPKTYKACSDQLKIWQNQD